MGVPCGLYSSETWTLTTKTQSRLQASEMRFLQYVLGVSRRDRLSNDDIRNILGIHNLNKSVKQYRQNWEDHVETMNKNRIQNQILVYNLKGR